MKDVYTVTDLGQVRLLADPLRLRIMEALKGETSLTTKQLAVRLGEKPTKLYHHVELLESSGLIKQTETRRVRGTVEKYYRSAAKAIEVDPKVFSAAESSEVGDIVTVMFMSLIDSIRAEAKRSVEKGLIGAAGDADPLLVQLPVCASKNRIEKIKRMIKKHAEDVQREAGERVEGDAIYSLVLAFYPVDES